VSAGYTLGALAGKGLLSLSYTKSIDPLSAYTWQLSFRYFFDTQTSMSAGVGGTGHANGVTLSLDRATPQGEGVGYTVSGASAWEGGVDGAYGQAFAQVNASHLAFGANYARSSTRDVGPSFSQLFVAGSIGAVGGSVFAARPVQDSFALVRIPGIEGVPVYANGWYAGMTDGRGEVVATNLASYYDNYVSFRAAELPLDYQIDRVEQVISPPARSGTPVTFTVRKSRAVYGSLVVERDGNAVPLEFRDIRLARDGAAVGGFTARRGEFYVDGLEPGEYVLTAYGDPGCAARVVVPEQGAAMVDLGAVVCAVKH
jgi:outer membrane usher protein